MQLALLRKDGNIGDFIQQMNTYLELNPNDGEAWLQLGDLYLEHLNYNRALFCYEEVVVLFPKRFIYLLRLAEIYYTLGTVPNL